MSYTITQEPAHLTYKELEPLYRKHYNEMQARLQSEGVDYVSEFRPRLDAYFKASAEGWMLSFVLRMDGKPIGYSNIYLTNDMHNGDLIAQEDTIYVRKEYRIGLGRKLADHIHAELKRRNVKRMNVTTITDPRVGKWLERQGYKHTGQCMTINF